MATKASLPSARCTGRIRLGTDLDDCPYHRVNGAHLTRFALVMSGLPGPGQAAIFLWIIAVPRAGAKEVCSCRSRLDDPRMNAERTHLSRQRLRGAFDSPLRRVIRRQTRGRSLFRIAGYRDEAPQPPIRKRGRTARAAQIGPIMFVSTMFRICSSR